MVNYDPDVDLPEVIRLDENYYQLPADVTKKEYKEIEYYVRQSF